MVKLPAYKTYKAETQIALLDNSSIAFLQYLKYMVYSSKLFFYDYDLILIPNWGLVEIEDSDFRHQYINSLHDAGFPIYTIEEENYVNLIDHEDINFF